MLYIIRTPQAFVQCNSNKERVIVHSKILGLKATIKNKIIKCIVSIYFSIDFSIIAPNYYVKYVLIGRIHMIGKSF